jgi:hypothetical protein
MAKTNEEGLPVDETRDPYNGESIELKDGEFLNTHMALSSIYEEKQQEFIKANPRRNINNLMKNQLGRSEWNNFEYWVNKFGPDIENMPGYLREKCLNAKKNSKILRNKIVTKQTGKKVYNGKK